MAETYSIADLARYHASYAVQAQEIAKKKEEERIKAERMQYNKDLEEVNALICHAVANGKNSFEVNCEPNARLHEELIQYYTAFTDEGDSFARPWSRVYTLRPGVKQ